MDNHILKRVNSCIKVRKERADAFIVNQYFLYFKKNSK